jgi:predicted TPR repeat methyltransferase
MSTVTDSMEHTPTTDRALTLDEAISFAVQLQQSQQFAAAAGIYQKILEVAPAHADALHFSGILAHQTGRGEEAVALMARSLEIEPNRADWHSNFGIVLRDQLRLDDAVAACRRAIALEPNHANACSNLGVLLRAQGHVAEAEAAYRDAIRVSPGHIDAHHNLGVLLQAEGRTREAVVCFCKVITLSPKYPEARRLLAAAHCTLGEIDKAVVLYKEWLADEPDDPIAQHLLAACTGHDVPERASDTFVEQMFDAFANSFDSRLSRLQYRAPALVAAALAECEPDASKRLEVLDAGCGTGLCGPLLAPHARRLVGVDLSAGMLARARERNVYDDLVKGELTSYLRAAHDAFDVIVSADTLVYFGPLDEVVSAAAGALRRGGHFIFTVEALSDDASQTGYVIAPHGRYCHTRQYLDRLLGSAGLRPEIQPAELRIEGGLPVQGFVVRGTKPADGGVSHA